MKKLFSLFPLLGMGVLSGICHAQLPSSPLQIDAQLVCFEGNSSVEFLIKSKYPVLADVGTLVSTSDSTYVLRGISAGQVVTISRISGDDTLRSVHEVPVVETEPLPTPLVSSRTVCIGEPLGELQALAADGLAVDWYDAPVGGKLLASGQSTFSPPAPGRYFAESRDPKLPCRAVSGSRGVGTVTVKRLLCPIVLVRKVRPSGVQINQ